MNKKELEKIKDWVELYCAEHDLFLVDIAVGAGKITISVDTMENITIEQCAKLSRYLHGKLEEETDILNDYTVDVSSPGMTNSLKLPIQFKKRLNTKLNLCTDNGLEFEAMILSVNDEGIEAEQTIPANKKSKEPEKTIHHKLTYNQIIKATIPFKFKK